MAFATVAEYRAKYNSDLGDDALSVWLEDASGVMSDEMDEAGVDYSNPSESMAARLVRICRDTVHRAIGDGSDSAFSIPDGATQFSVTAGPYTAQSTMGNPYGKLFLTRDEKRALGVLRVGVGWAPIGGRDD